ncbi:hypothetical protein A2982_04165 [candidate division WWE3 bacterium RIFCSPLOWO2_01_FULL_39_13]|uniref:Uncharacterized protein n=1 Tax=candidate division WWE3 bacterium RIFCSPLOWO2_01_FULL_39_13 TaxID=1802624 RepID=A0A1F4V438_UNCKA|nr:MAG: hypothetical protein A2982_04165 [candidate division WWE3 bacterium RIFCSPLOWO2_01_FULL_39_13]
MSHSEMKLDFKITKILVAISSVLLIFAFLDLPYFYYQISRIVVSGTSFFLSYNFYLKKKAIGAVVMFLLAIIFNPIIPIYMNKDTWIIFDILAVIILVSAEKILSLLNKS